MNSGLIVKDVIVQMPNSFQYQLEGGLCMGRGGGLITRFFVQPGIPLSVNTRTLQIY